MEGADGGAAGWVQVSAAFLMTFNAWGLVNAFGVFEAFYATGTLRGQSASAISWIGSIQAATLLGTSVVAGPVFDRGYGRALVIAGTMTVTIGMMLTSLCGELYQYILAQGIFVGIGAGLLYLPSVAICARYFVKRRALAIGVASAGSSAGGVVYGIMVHQLGGKVGTAWTARIMGFVALGTLLVACAVVRDRGGRGRAGFSLHGWDAPFVLFSVGNFAMFAGLYIPFYFITRYGQEVAGMDANAAFYLVPIINASTAVGRIGGNMLGTRVGALRVLTGSVTVGMLIGFTWVVNRNPGGMYAMTVIYGIVAGTMVGVAPTVVAQMSDVEEVGRRMAVCFTMQGLGVLMGGPVAGHVIRGTDYLGAQMFCGGMLAGGVVIYLAVDVARTVGNRKKSSSGNR